MKIVPALARIAFGLNRSVRGEAATTASTAGAIGAAQDRAEVARLLDPLDDRDQRIVRQHERVELERRDPRDRDQPLRPLAEGELGEDRLARRLDDDAAVPQAAQGVEGGARVGTGQQRLADEHLDEVGTGVDRAPDLAGAVDQGQAGPVALASVAQAPRRP